MSREYTTIGEVVEELRARYDDLSISKIRFLEEEGLISPERTPGGYRKFSRTDIARIELVLRLQKEHFLPLAVIRDKLADLDKGKVPPELRGAGSVEASAPFEQEDTGTVPVDEIPSALGLPASFVKELAEYNLIELVQGEGGPEIGQPDIRIAHICWDMRRFGVEPRHLRMYGTFAEREATFFSQILMPASRHRTADTRRKLAEMLAELTELTRDLSAHLLRRSLGRVFEDSV